MRRTRTIATFLGALLIAALLIPSLARSAPAPATPGLARLVATAGNADLVEGVATFGGHTPSASELAALRGLGLQAQGFRNLPLALVRGPLAAVQQAVATGAAQDVYPNEQLQWMNDESNRSIRADAVQKTGVTGKGVGVAIVDSGVDATHPELDDNVVRNVKIVGQEYLPGQTSGDASIVLPVDQGPYNNSDTSGHGTHVAGIVGAEGSEDPTLKGVAPEADLYAYGTGDVVFVYTVLAAFDDILGWNESNDPKASGLADIRVVNNSWGSNFRLFDPNEPINQASKALHDAGLVVTFSAGNDGIEMSLNPYSAAPWVISVGSGTIARTRSDFTSGGIRFDNSQLATIPDDGHLHFEGDRIGLYHPDVSGPGTDITSTGTPTGVGIASPAPPGGTATISGTSMSSPHVAGVAALLLQARPTLTPDQVRDVLQVTAVPMADESAFWEIGYGWVDVPTAVKLVRRADFSAKVLRYLMGLADNRVQRARPYTVASTDFWAFPAAPVTVGGVPDFQTYEVEVPSTTKAIKAIVGYPSLNYVGLNEFDYRISVFDAKGVLVGESEPNPEAGQSVLEVDLRQTKGLEAPGTWTIEVSGDLGASDMDTLMGKTVSLTFAQLKPQTAKQPPKPTFKPTGALAHRFAADGDATPLTTPEGCEQEAGAPKGAMVAALPGDAVCRSGAVGFVVNYGAADPAVFESTPLAKAATIGGTATMTFFLSQPNAPADIDVNYTLLAIGSDGSSRPVTAGTLTGLAAGPDGARNDLKIPVAPTQLPAGSKLRLELLFPYVNSTYAMRLLYGGGSFADAGLTLQTGTLS